MAIRFTPLASSDLEAIGDYIAQDNPLSVGIGCQYELVGKIAYLLKMQRTQLGDFDQIGLFQKNKNTL